MHSRANCSDVTILSLMKPHVCGSLRKDDLADLARNCSLLAARLAKMTLQHEQLLKLQAVRDRND